MEVQLSKKLVIAWVRPRLTHFAIRIVLITESDTVRGANLLTGRADIRDDFRSSPLVRRLLRFYLASINSLVTIIAFLHNPSESDGNVWISGHEQQLVFVLNIDNLIISDLQTLP